MEKKLKIAIACGGTGGHIFPGLATAQVLVERGHDVTLWMAGKDIEQDAVKDWSGKVVTIPAEGFQFGLSMRSILTVFRLLKAYRLSLAKMKKDPPDVLLAMGSYASFGPTKAANRLKIPYVLHEANLVPGRAVSLLSRKAHTIAVSFEKTGFHLKHKRIETTGMPLRRELCHACTQTRSKRKDGAPIRILVMGGSRGAQVLNETVPEAIAAAVQNGVRVEVVHLAGVQNAEGVETIYDKAQVKARVHPFVQDVSEIYLNTDLGICRSGAATCAELAAFGIPALLVPYPFAIRNHQMSNARAFQDPGAADVIAQDDLTATWLRDYLVKTSQQPDRLERMGEAMKKKARADAAERLADLLEKTGGA